MPQQQNKVCQMYLWKRVNGWCDEGRLKKTNKLSSQSNVYTVKTPLGKHWSMEDVLSMWSWTTLLLNSDIMLHSRKLWIFKSCVPCHWLGQKAWMALVSQWTTGCLKNQSVLSTPHGLMKWCNLKALWLRGGCGVTKQRRVVCVHCSVPAHSWFNFTSVFIMFSH